MEFVDSSTSLVDLQQCSNGMSTERKAFVHYPNGNIRLTGCSSGCIYSDTQKNKAQGRASEGNMRAAFAHLNKFPSAAPISCSPVDVFEFLDFRFFFAQESLEQG